MGRLANAIPRRLNKAIAGMGVFGSCVVAILILGPMGAAASLIFMPILLTLMLNTPDERGDFMLSAIPDTRAYIAGALSRFLGQIGQPTVSLVIEIDDFNRLEEVHDRAVLDGVLTFTQSVIETHLTDEDVTVNLDGACFASALAPQASYDLEVMLNTCTRIQHSLNSAHLFGDVPLQLSASIGFASSSKLERPTGDTLLQASFTALTEARRKGPGAVRGFSQAMSSKRNSQRRIGKEAAGAFQRGEIFSYFQPQLCLTDGTLSGFEALTRWHHPERGIISPADFLPALEQAGLMDQLGDTMIKQALQALTYWDKSGINVPRIGVNFSTCELRDPLLVDRVAMLLDASGIEARRLVIEVLETVVANDSDDDIICNLAALSDLGCGIDLDDFGTGYASITNIRRFSVGRIKIDRSFVAGLDNDPEQRNMVSAILTMAERLGVKTLAEGVETKGEQAALAGLGCHDAQGFHIARPMPLEETVDWAKMQLQAAREPVQFSKRTG